MKVLSPKSRCQYITSHLPKYLSKSCSKITDNMQQVEGRGQTITEIDMYFVDENLAGIDVNLSYIECWNEVQTVIEGNWPKYDILHIFSLVTDTFFNTNSEVERALSVETDIHYNSVRNRMS